jgi:peptide/nickel transport system substrate-binding protein
VASTRKAFVVGLLAVVLLAAGYAGWRVARSGTAPDTASGDVNSQPTRGGELVATLRTEPTGYLRIAEVDGTAAGDVLSLLTDARLLRVNRATDVLEPALAESWTESPDHLTYTLKLRQGVAFSDGAPFTSADVLFTFAVLYDARVNSGMASDMKVAGQPLRVEAPDASTVVIRLPSPFAPGLRLLDNLPIVPRHKLQSAFEEGRLAQVWRPGTVPAEVVGLGPFMLSEHVAGQRLVLARNPHYWGKAPDGTALPYLDRLTIAFISDQNSEALRLQSGEADLMSNGDIRPDDYPAFRRLAEQGRLRLIPGGTSLDPNLLWFNLSSSRAADPRRGWLGQKAFRHAISCAVDRQAIANAVYLGEAEVIYGPISSGNRTWYVPPANPCNHDVARARTLLASAGLADRNGDGMVEDSAGTPARFSILTQSGHTIRERTAAMLQEQLRQIGITVDVVGLDPGGLAERWQKGDYDAIYFGVQNSQTDPALTAQFWLSSGHFHFWNPGQPSPATEWERRIDDLMRQIASEPDTAERKRLFTDVLRIFEEESPALYLVAPKVTLAVSSRVTNERPAPQIPQLLWSADTLAAAGAGRQ